MADKKNSYYPLECEIKNKSRSIKGQILVISSRGFLFNAGNFILSPGEKFSVHIDFPMFKKMVDAECMAVKVYDTFKGRHGALNPGDHRVEFLFKGINSASTDLIAEFLAREKDR